MLFILCALAIIALGEYSVYSSFHEALYYSNPYLFYTFTLSLYVFPILLITTAILGFKYFSKIGSYLYVLSGIWLGLLIYLFMGSALLTFYITINFYHDFGVPIHTIGIDIFLIAVIIIIYGVYNALTPRIVKWQIKSSALLPLWRNKKIILISDTHLGHIQRDKFSQKLVATIANENPDIVFHVGDIIDGPTFPYKKSFDHFESLNPPLGTFYVEGNHETYSREYDTFKSHFPKNITDMTDKKIIINGTHIIGLSFNQYESKDQTKKRVLDLGYDISFPSIILLHDPKNSGALSDLEVSLVLSGHTHGGQFFPDNLILRSIYKSFSHGITYLKNTVSATTYGTGMTLLPIRIGTFPEIVVIEII